MYIKNQIQKDPEVFGLKIFFKVPADNYTLVNHNLSSMINCRNTIFVPNFMYNVSFL